MSKFQDESSEEIMILTQEAYKLAATAFHFDKMQNFVGACDYYDKCILNMDEVLNKLNPDSAEWKRLYEIRSKYDDRMEVLRENDTANSFSLTSLAVGKTETKPSNTIRLPRSRRRLGEAETDFKDISWNETSQEAPPEDTTEVTYWLLRNLRRTMESGGFLTKDLFIPKRIWIQNDVKFSGLGAKIAAFEILIKLITNHTEALYLSLDEDSLDLADAAFNFVYEELVSLQNNLSKPFPYIKELSQSGSRDDLSAEVSSTGSPSSTSKGTGNAGRATSISSFVSSFGKNVRKYAEVGFQRLVVALPSRLSSEELEEYVLLVTKLCEKCQVLNTWYTFIKSTAEHVTINSDLTATTTTTTSTVSGDTTSSEQQQQQLAGAASGTTFIAEAEGGARPVAIPGRGRKQSMQLKIDSIWSALVNISAAIRDIAVEILFRDLEYLLDKYLTDMRKAFCRMYWDDDLDSTQEG